MVHLSRAASLGLNIRLPHEQEVNRYVPRKLVFNFHYFFMRKLGFVYLAKGLVTSGGFGTVDDLSKSDTDSDCKPQEDHACGPIRYGVLDNVINSMPFPLGTVGAETCRSSIRPILSMTRSVI